MGPWNVSYVPVYIYLLGGCLSNDDKVDFGRFRTKSWIVDMSGTYNSLSLPFFFLLNFRRKLVCVG